MISPLTPLIYVVPQPPGTWKQVRFPRSKRRRIRRKWAKDPRYQVYVPPEPICLTDRATGALLVDPATYQRLMADLVRL